LVGLLAAQIASSQVTIDVLAPEEVRNTKVQFSESRFGYLPPAYSFEGELTVLPREVTACESL
jgi:hypothetical protein